ncbi:MAG: hypothetical protein COB84_02715 [Rhodobacteraceae bacterium]|nr:MAG: hypothetical protein COB84_02715 [Paracoccaceae bacterium]
MNSLKAFVYFAEYDVVKEMMPDWPSEMRLAIGLHATGKCELIVFHHHEASLIIKRISRILNLPVGHFGVVPERQGYPTKVIRFSDQQLLMKLITAKDDLCETASDYAINYRFAVEEGLDPLYFTSLVDKGKKPVQVKKSQDKAVVVPFTSRRTQVSVARGAATKDIYYEGRFAELALIEKRGKYIRVTLNPDCITPDTPTLKAIKVGQRDEQGQLILERSLLGAWTRGSSAIIEIRMEKLSSKLSSGYFEQPYTEAVIIVPNGIFVTYNFKIECDDEAIKPIESTRYPFHKNAMRGLTFSDTQKMYK